MEARHGLAEIAGKPGVKGLERLPVSEGEEAGRHEKRQVDAAITDDGAGEGDEEPDLQHTDQGEEDATAGEGDCRGWAGTGRRSRIGRFVEDQPAKQGCGDYGPDPQ